MIALIAAALVAAPQTTPPSSAPAQAPVLLSRVFKPNEKLSYSVKSSLQSQQRQLGLQTFIPIDLDISYNFTIQTVAMKADGIAVLQYLRPTMTQVDGETYDSPPKTHVTKVDYNLLLTVSPINEILEIEDKAKPKKKEGARWLLKGGASPVQLQQLIGPYIGEIYRLSLFVGSLDSSLDFSPKLSFDDVAVGDTWKKTVSYQPQKVKGSEKQAVQRLDYTYTYKGMDTYNNRKVYKINGALNLDTDLAEFFNQSFGLKTEESILKKIPLQMKADVNFYLDAVTKHTIYAVANTEGGYSITISQSPNEPVQEEKLKGKTELKLLGTTIVKPVVKPVKK